MIEQVRFTSKMKREILDVRGVLNSMLLSLVFPFCCRKYPPMSIAILLSISSAFCFLVFLEKAPLKLTDFARNHVGPLASHSGLVSDHAKYLPSVFQLLL